MMKKILNYAFLLLLIPLGVGCSSDGIESDSSGTGGSPHELAFSELGLTESQQGMVLPLNDFSLSLFRQLS